MKDTETKEAFITARAEGKSYSTIAKELGISKGTCTSWAKELKGEIDGLRRERLEALYDSYQMTREARIQKIGDTIKRIDKTLDIKGLNDVPADKLLSLKLKYEHELQSEYTETQPDDTDDTLESLLEQYNRLYEDARAGRLSVSDIKIQLDILGAKKRTLETIATEKTRQDTDSLDIADCLIYRSPLLRENVEETN